jgi:hypothetical protein
MTANEIGSQSGDEMNGYNFDSGSFQDVRKSWDDILASLEADLAAAQDLIVVKAPGHEPASGFVAATQKASGEALVNAINQMRAFATSYKNNLAQTQQEYQAQETSSSGNFTSGVR